VYGLQGTSKLQTVCAVLSAREITHAVVKSRECLSLRHLLSKIYTACVATLYTEGDERAEELYHSRTDSVNALYVNLQKLLQGRHEKLVLVLDGIDKQKGVNPTTLPALARLGDLVGTIEYRLQCDAEI
jgi:origin recognition complex subunit 5